MTVKKKIDCLDGKNDRQETIAVQVPTHKDLRLALQGHDNKNTARLMRFQEKCREHTARIGNAICDERKNDRQETRAVQVPTHEDLRLALQGHDNKNTARLMRFQEKCREHTARIGNAIRDESVTIAMNAVSDESAAIIQDLAIDAGDQNFS
ncbi:hypothetical protein THAOC_00973 [Thalassiosira oceanica]|uniref:Uncharacterized protein n=1 Tax=Thalassiosira oceanica TaxID=159749 RepID=K0TJD3_THAOC|nr:hypothetical protein THAOC_00973 [Thalassiosira oceanica]|eukprot:EJK77209.1 hypothetical protein THAOC_00973 [Thalassiosira oceanica]